MKLKEACDIGYACGLSTVDEAILNVEIHCSNIFSYGDATLELYELHEEAKPYLNKNTVRSAMGSPLTCMLAAVQGKPEVPSRPVSYNSA